MLNDLKVRVVNIDALLPYANNARVHSTEQINQIAMSISEFGFNVPCLVDKNNILIAGHGRVLAAKSLGIEEVPVIYIEHLNEDQIRAFRIADNKIAENSSWNIETLEFELGALREANFDISITGFGDDDLELTISDDKEVVLDKGAHSVSKLSERFGIPPFSVLDARKGWWQERKRAWIDLGIRSELGRGAAPGGSSRPLDRARMSKANASPSGSPLPAADYSKSKARGDGRGRRL
jgi:hypothetical protein